MPFLCFALQPYYFILFFLLIPFYLLSSSTQGDTYTHQPRVSAPHSTSGAPEPPLRCRPGIRLVILCGAPPVCTS